VRKISRVFVAHRISATDCFHESGGAANAGGTVDEMFDEAVDAENGEATNTLNHNRLKLIASAYVKC
jgi:hypothetical protein